MKPYLWDYDEEELKKTEQGRIFILESRGLRTAAPCLSI